MRFWRASVQAASGPIIAYTSMRMGRHKRQACRTMSNSTVSEHRKCLRVNLRDLPRALVDKIKELLFMCFLTAPLLNKYHVRTMVEMLTYNNMQNMPCTQYFTLDTE